MLKLSALGFWRYVVADAGTYESGNLEVRMLVDELKEVLLRRQGDFQTTIRLSSHLPDPRSAGFLDFSEEPIGGPAPWSARELRAEGALHFKHFPGSNRDVVQAHVDGSGATLGTGDLVVEARQLYRHLRTYDSYQQPQVIRAILLRQGLDRETLNGEQREPVGPARSGGTQ